MNFFSQKSTPLFERDLFGLESTTPLLKRLPATTPSPAETQQRAELDQLRKEEDLYDKGTLK